MYMEFSGWRCHEAILQAGARAVPKRAWWRHHVPICDGAQDGERAWQGRREADVLPGEAEAQEGRGQWLWAAKRMRV
jgi:hypothetical protein